MVKLRRVGMLFFAVILIIALLPFNVQSKAGVSTKPKKVVELKIFQFKVEISGVFNKLIQKYEKNHPGVKIEAETVGGGGDYDAALKTKFAAGEEPDIFNNGGYADLDAWVNKLEDLSKEPWVKYLIPGTDLPMTKNGKLYGQPMNIEGYGFVYNKALFSKAGIKELPKNLNELDNVCKKLKNAGITPFSNGYKEWWILGIHNFNLLLTQQKDPTRFINGLKDNSIKLSDNKSASDWLNLMDLTMRYGYGDSLNTSYETQVSNFAAGKTAMMQQGNWTQVQIDRINPKMKLGILPMPLNNQIQDSIPMGVPNYWVINKDSRYKKEAKDFLNWMVSSKDGQKCIVNDFKFIPAFKNIQYTEKEVGALGESIKEYASKGKRLTWEWFRLPGRSTDDIGAAMQMYISGTLNRAQLLDKIQNIVYEYAQGNTH